MTISSQPIQPRQPAQPAATPKSQAAESAVTTEGMVESTVPQAGDDLTTSEGLDDYDTLTMEALDPGPLSAPNDHETLNQLYQLHLGRDVDPTGLDAWGKLAVELRAQGKTEVEISQALQDKIVNSPEYHAKMADQNLGRAPAKPGDAVPAAPVAGETPDASPGSAPYINQVNPNGKDGSYSNGESNCGPTSMAMIARAAGYGEGMTDAQLIMHLGQMGGTGSEGTSVNGIAAMAKGIGKSAETRGPGANVEWIRSQLESGKMVVANGDYYAMGDHNRAKVGQGGHYVAVVGLDADGKFLVNDPYDSKISPKAFSADELATFISSNSNGGYQVAVG